jgi:diguanylate cyclase (GGDEF)-like protein
MRPPPSEIADSQEARERLAKAWLVRIVQNTPLEELDDLPIAWIAREAPPLIADIVAGLADEGAEGGAPTRGRVGAAVDNLARLRRGEDAPTRIPRDLAALQALLIETLGDQVPERAEGEFGRSVGRLAEVFGDVQAAATEALVRERSGDPKRDPLTGLPGLAEFHEWIRILLAEHRRYRHPFSVCLVDTDGLARIADAYGRDAGDRMLAAVSSVIEGQIRAVDRAFRLADDEFAVITPHQTALDVRPMAERLAHVVDSSQSGESPRLAIAIGIASCPEHGEAEDELLSAAEEGVYTAQAEGTHVGIAGLEDGLFLQDH